MENTAEKKDIARDDIAPKMITPKMHDALRGALADAGLAVPPDALRDATKKITDIIGDDVADLLDRALPLNTVLDTFGKTGIPESDMMTEEPAERPTALAPADGTPADASHAPARPTPAPAASAPPAEGAALSAEPQVFGASAADTMPEKQTPLITTDESGFPEEQPPQTASAIAETAPPPASSRAADAATAPPPPDAQTRSIQNRIEGFSNMRARVLRERKKLERAAMPLELQKRTLSGTRQILRMISWFLYLFGALLSLVGIGELLLAGALALSRSAALLKRNIAVLTARLKPIAAQIKQLNDRITELNKDIQASARQMILFRTQGARNTSRSNRPNSQQAFSS
jgi:hypothetical protein